jgi:3-methyl-2-oxobutanoate hydroxymethyltransferase
MNVQAFQKMKQEGRKISMLTCYDAWSAKILAETPVDCLLVGDSAAMIMHGEQTTLPATLELMAQHVRAVARSAPGKFIVGDMPFLSFRMGLEPTMRAVQLLMQAGAHAIKLEGVRGHEEIVSHIVESGVPVMGHLGLTPQSVHHLGGMKVQAREAAQADALLCDARKLQELGCFALVLECIPTELARKVTDSLEIPTIGIGAGVHCSGQVLVLQDMLGLNPGFKPKFLRTYLNGFEMIQRAVTQFDEQVKSAEFPGEKETYS